MAAGPWFIALYGSDTFQELDSNHEIAMATLDPTVNLLDPDWYLTQAGWLPLEILGGDADYVEDNETTEVPGGFEIEKCTTRLVLNAEIVPIAFDSADIDDYAKYDMSLIADYVAIKNKKYKYLFNINYPVTLHTAAKAVCVNIRKKLEHIHEQGTKKLVIEIRKIGVEP